MMESDLTNSQDEYRALSDGEFDEDDRILREAYGDTSQSDFVPSGEDVSDSETEIETLNKKRLYRRHTNRKQLSKRRTKRKDRAVEHESILNGSQENQETPNGNIPNDAGVQQEIVQVAAKLKKIDMTSEEIGNYYYKFQMVIILHLIIDEHCI